MLQLSRNYFLKNFQYFVFIAIVFLMPFTKNYLPYLMFIWVLAGVLSVRQIKIKTDKSLIIIIFPVLFYIMHGVGLFYTDNFKDGFFDLEVKLTILFIPLVAIFTTDKVKDSFRIVLKLFVYANLLASFACLFFAFSNSIIIDGFGNIVFQPSYWIELRNLNFLQLINERASFFSYEMLSIFHHPAYFSLYILFSIVILVYLIRSSQKKRIGFYGLIVYFTVFLWLLGSRAAFITYLAGLISFFIILILRFRKYGIGLFVLVLGLFISTVLLSNKQIRSNIKETIELIKNKPLHEKSDIRLWIWKSGFEIFKDNFWIGVGTGDIDGALSKKYKEYHLEHADEHNYNTHNQYLDTALKLGIVGLFILLNWIMYAFYVAIKKKQFLFFFFMLIISINFLFETILNSIAGVAFFAFFYVLLVSSYINKEDLKDKG